MLEMGMELQSGDIILGESNTDKIFLLSKLDEFNFKEVWVG